MNHSAHRLSWIALLVLVAVLCISGAVYAGTVTPASGGTLSADTAVNGGTSAWTTLTGPSYAESTNGDLNNGTLTLNAPAGFEFRTGVTVSVVLVTGANNAVTNMNGTPVGGTVASTASNTLTVTSTSITFVIESKSRGNVLNTIRWTGIEVRPLNGFPLASGNITGSGSSDVATAANVNNFGTLTTVPGAMARLLTGLPGQSFTAGTGFTGTPTNQTADTPFVLAGLVATDKFYNVVPSYSGSKAITYTGPSSNCSGVSSYTNSVSFTNGISTSTLSTRLRTAETTTITASDSIVTGPASTSFTVNAAAANRLVITLPGQTFVRCIGNQGTPDEQTAGVGFILTSITAVDSFFNIATSYTGNKTLIYSGPSGPGSYTTPVNFSSGQSTTVLSTTIANAQTTTLKVDDGTISGPNSSSFVVKARAISNFNAFDTATPSGSVSGTIKTKIAGAAFALDVVALNGTTSTATVATSFSGAVKVELVDGSGTSACASRTLIQTLPNQGFTTTDQGRRTISGISVPNVWKNVAVRISYPVSSPTTVVCASDNFAIRPVSFAQFSVTDQDSQTAGTARALNNTAATGTTVHKAGRPFTIRANAVNNAGTVTSNYSDTPTLVLSQCTSVTTACPASANLGTLNPGTWTITSGALSTSTATYSEVGAFNLVLQDQHFADVDVSDSTTSERYISSTPLDVGRFVPDHFTVVPVSITPRTDLSCATSTFTYMNEPFQARFELHAKNVAETTTVNYAGALARLDPSDASQLQFGAINNATALVAPISAITRANPGRVTTGRPHGLSTGARVFISGVSGMTNVNNTLVTATVIDANNFTIGVDTSAFANYIAGGHVSRLAVSASSGIWMAGKATITSTLTLQRVALPDGPFTSTRIGIAPQDTDGVQATSLNLDADTSGTSERVQLGTTSLLFGRLWLGNALGSELSSLSMPLQAQYWTGTGFGVSANDNCTAVTSATNVLLTNPLGGITATNMKNPGNVLIGAAFSAGIGRLTLTKPTPAPTAKGSIDVTVDLAAEAKTYLQTNGANGVYNQNPKARATFGVNRGSTLLYQRELY